jgi:hypothetical protein
MIPDDHPSRCPLCRGIHPGFRCYKTPPKTENHNPHSIHLSEGRGAHLSISRQHTTPAGQLHFVGQVLGSRQQSTLHGIFSIVGMLVCSQATPASEHFPARYPPHGTCNVTTGILSEAWPYVARSVLPSSPSHLPAEHTFAHNPYLPHPGGPRYPFRCASPSAEALRGEIGGVGDAPHQRGQGGDSLRDGG